MERAKSIVFALSTIFINSTPLPLRQTSIAMTKKGVIPYQLPLSSFLIEKKMARDWIPVIQVLPWESPTLKRTRLKKHPRVIPAGHLTSTISSLNQLRRIGDWFCFFYRRWCRACSAWWTGKCWSRRRPEAGGRRSVSAPECDSARWTRRQSPPGSWSGRPASAFCAASATCHLRTNGNRPIQWNAIPDSSIRSMRTIRFYGWRSFPE